MFISPKIISECYTKSAFATAQLCFPLHTQQNSCTVFLKDITENNHY